MNICIVTPYWTPIKGGVTSFVYNLSNHLKNKNLNVHVFAREGITDQDATVFFRNKIIFVILVFYNLLKIRPKVVHSHSHWYTLMPCVLYKLVFSKKTLIHTLHTDIVLDEVQSSHPIINIKEYIFQSMLNYCDTLTFVSESMKQKNFQIRKIKTNVKVIYAGADQIKITEEELDYFKKSKSIDGFPIISFIGPFVWEKKVEGIKRLIDSVKIIKTKYPSINLLLIGDGFYRTELEQQVNDLDLKNNVIFTGFLDDVFAPLMLSDIYTHITLQDSIPISILEAMSIGKPVISTYTGGIPEVIINDQTGILVDPKPTEIANAIIELYEDKEKMKLLGCNALKFVEINHSWEKTCEEFIKIYNINSQKK